MFWLLLISLLMEALRQLSLKRGFISWLKTEVVIGLNWMKIADLLVLSIYILGAVFQAW